MDFLDNINYWIAMFQIVMGLFIVIASENLIKTLVGLGIFQSAVYIIYISPAKIFGGTAPILIPDQQIYANPLPHVLILTAIVVGVATIALGLALVVKIYEAYGTLEEDKIQELDLMEDEGV
tara:strand:+ start:463 stop:828 length:366 start_codon:yes stop_codon:yes gene_type:complete